MRIYIYIFVNIYIDIDIYLLHLHLRFPIQEPPARCVSLPEEPKGIIERDEELEDGLLHLVSQSVQGDAPPPVIGL